MPEKWTGRIVGIMHVNQISYEELARELGVTKPYAGMILNGVRKPPDAEKRVSAAINNILARRKELKTKEE